MWTCTALPAFSDNYIWMLADETSAIVVDPGDAAPVQAALRARGLSLAAILVTHHHPDHIAGLAALAASDACPVYGPRAEAKTIPGLTQCLDDGDRVILSELGIEFEVLSVPGHTRGHIAFYQRAAQRLFCGDTLFSAGCGRLFEGTAAQLYESLNRLNALPADTQVFCTHEYTLSNLAFAAAAEPENPAIAAHRRQVETLRERNQPSLPSHLALERRINPFLRCAEPAIMRRAAEQFGQAPGDPLATFTALRRWKDGFRTA